MLPERKDDAAWIGLQEEPLRIEEAMQFVSEDDAGGNVFFAGTTRGRTGERETVLLEYECYPAMAIEEMARIAREAASRWQVRRACVLHRVGEVPVGEASVLIAVSTPHRSDAFEACRYLIDRLKQQVPIWKKEVLRDGRREWVEGNAPEIRP